MPPTVSQRVVEIGACGTSGTPVSICYDAFGQEGSECICFIAGLNCQCLMWPDSLCEMLAEEGYYVIRFDNRDTGLSTHLDNQPTPSILRMLLPAWASIKEVVPYTLNDMADDVARFLSTLGILRAHIVGASMGGMIAQLVAIRHPKCAASLCIFFSDVGGNDVVAPSLWMYRSFLRRPKSDSVDDLARFRIERISEMWGRDEHGNMYYPFDEEDMFAFYQRMFRRSTYVGGLVRHIAAIKRAPSRKEDLKKLSLPTVVIHGTVDPLIPAENGKRLAEYIPNAKLVIYPKLGHSLPKELFADFTSVIAMNAKKASSNP